MNVKISKVDTSYLKSIIYQMYFKLQNLKLKQKAPLGALSNFGWQPHSMTFSLKNMCVLGGKSCYLVGVLLLKENPKEWLNMSLILTTCYDSNNCSKRFVQLWQNKRFGHGQASPSISLSSIS